MNRHTSLLVVIILGVIALALIHALNNNSNTKRESFKDENETNNEASPKNVNPHRLHLATNSESCDNLLDRKGFVSVQEFMDGSRYSCY